MIVSTFPFPRKRALLRCALAATLAAGSMSAATLDTLLLGSNDSEDQHAVKTVRAETFTGGLGVTPRRLLPLEQPD